MKPLLSLLLCLSFCSPALAVDPPPSAPATTTISWAANPLTVTVREIASGKYGGERFVIDELVTSPIYALSPTQQLGVTNVMAAHVDESYTMIAVTPLRGNPIDLKDTVLAVAQLPTEAPHHITFSARDLPVLVVDHGGGKFSGQVSVNGTVYTWPIYQMSTSFSLTKVAEDLAGKDGEIITLRTVIVQRTVTDRALLVFEVLD